MASLWTKFTDIFSRNKSGVVPQAPSGTGTSKYLREDGIWAVPSGGGGGGSSALADLEDVNLLSPSNNQVLGYNATTQKWENKNQSGGGHTYFTTEQVVGTWIDGKPIYQKTYDLGSQGIALTNGSFVHSGIIAPDIELEIKSEGIETSGQQIVISVGRYSANSEIALGSFLIGGATRSIRYLTIWYTKTTD